ncbi:MAG: hypothetical protein DCF19_19355 [Pseudanabaena frigida]|uniref:Uncharacterized protein n=1 Tax=Pseudanabaena frigida TaxID=945775 RepID=A0A2W4XNH6_9CYAN|nr:MAG: hypothetical protein DCF19_19355 [Pseudanabaena frigida]
MSSVYFKSILEKRNQWLEEQIRKMSVDILSLGTYTCTVCGEVLGEYIIDYAGESIRLSNAETYAFLQFILETEMPS